MEVQEIREAAPAQLEKVRGRIQSKLRRQKRQEAMDDFLAAARNEYRVRVFDDAIAASIDSARYAASEREKPVAPAPVTE